MTDKQHGWWCDKCKGFVETALEKNVGGFMDRRCSVCGGPVTWKKLGEDAPAETEKATPDGYWWCETCKAKVAVAGYAGPGVEHDVYCATCDNHVRYVRGATDPQEEPSFSDAEKPVMDWFAFGTCETCGSPYRWKPTGLSEPEKQESSFVGSPGYLRQDQDGRILHLCEHVVSDEVTRAYLAGQALSGIIGGGGYPFDKGRYDAGTIERLSQNACDLADATMKKLDKEQSQEKTDG